MTTTVMPQAGQGSPTHTIRSVIRSGGRRGLIAAGAAIVVAGLAYNWSWLVAAGIAPVLVSLLPCAAMCAFGLCMNRMTGRSCRTDDTAKEGARNPKDLFAGMKGSG